MRPPLGTAARARSPPSAGRRLLVHAHDVALAVLEPGGPAQSLQEGDLAVPLHAGHVVDLEHHALGLEVVHLGLDVVHVPLGDRVSGLTGVAGLVDVERRACRRRVHEVDAGDLARRRQPELVRVEVPRSGEIGRWDVRFDPAGVQHGVLPRMCTTERDDHPTLDRWACRDKDAGAGPWPFSSRFPPAACAVGYSIGWTVQRRVCTAMAPSRKTNVSTPSSTRVFSETALHSMNRTSPSNTWVGTAHSAFGRSASRDRKPSRTPALPRSTPDGVMNRASSV